MLFGQRTWQDFLGHWPQRRDGNPFTDYLNTVRKYVVSTTLPDADAWQNSALLRGDGVAGVRALKDEPGNDLTVIGSAALVRSLHAAGLIDRYQLLIHPLVLGSGRRMFDETSPLTEFELFSCVPTTTGVLIAEYARA
jgi:dihydrofolate reductase